MEGLEPVDPADLVVPNVPESEVAVEETPAAPAPEGRDHWAQLAAGWGFRLPDGLDLTDEAVARFRDAANPEVSGNRRFLARTWLGEKGFLVDREKPAEESAAAVGNTPPLGGGRILAPAELPAHPVVENGVLGRMIVSPETVAQGAAALNQHDFSSAERMRLFVKLCDLHERGESITHLVIEAEFQATGMASLAARDLVSKAMLETAPTDALPKYFAILKDYAYRRAQVVAAQQILADASRGNATKDSLVRARAILDRVDEQYEREESLPSHLGKKWPEAMGEAAFHGLAGDFVRLIEPRTEADPYAILAQFLIAFGNVIGRKAHFSVDASRHYANEFVVVCGLTSRGRKGTGWEVTKLLFEKADPVWIKDCHHTGVASGEGLISTVRDPVFGQLKLGQEMHTTLEKEGVDDKRALWIEDEFQGVLSVMRREGSTLSANLRKAWQSGTLENASKQSPTRATGAHISVVGHITFDELERSLGQGEIGNGFANRFLWVCSKRSKLLPRGGNVFSTEFQEQLAPLAVRLKDAVSFAGDDLFGEIVVGMTEEAWALWDATYPVLSRTRLGNVGSVTDRAEAHVRRLALIYALLDASPKVTLAHLKAALAFWDYCERSVAFIFGNEDVDPVAERLLSALNDAGEEGMTQNQVIRKVFNGRKTEEVNKALGTLVRACLVRQVDKPTKGRPARVWVACR